MPAPAERPLTKAAEYVRMSTDHQKYSVIYQQAANRAFAMEHGFEIVRSYIDAGISGLGLGKRAGLKQLLTDVMGGAADYACVLVYDVSRWGRFQDPDESAHYEFICREAGVRIEYCAEPFDNDGSLTSTLVKHLKRAMAAEYSRELSVKVGVAKRGLSAQGYWCGGQPPYGFRRCVLKADGSPDRVLQSGEHRTVQGRRIILVAGPPDEVATIQRIYREFVVDGLGTPEISHRLNTEGIPANGRVPWTRGKVRRLLSDEKNAGVLVTGRVRTALQVTSPEPRAKWVRVVGACPELVSPQLFALAQVNLAHTIRHATDEQLLEALRACWRRHGHLSAGLLRITPGAASPSHYRKRFGSLMKAYAAAGYTPDRRQCSAAARCAGGAIPRTLSLSVEELASRIKALYLRHGRLTSDMIDEAPDLPSSCYVQSRLGNMLQLWRLVGAQPNARQLRAYWQARARRHSADRVAVRPNASEHVWRAAWSDEDLGDDDGGADDAP